MNKYRIANASLMIVCSLAMAMGAIGCKDRNSTDPTMRSASGPIEAPAAPVATTPSKATAPTPTPTSAVPEYTPAPQPVVYDSAPAPAPQPAAVQPAIATASPSAVPSAAGGRYKIRKGDTLYSIARTHYGDGKQYPRIVAANPGLSADHLVAGKTIVIP